MDLDVFKKSVCARGSLSFKLGVSTDFQGNLFLTGSGLMPGKRSLCRR